MVNQSYAVEYVVARSQFCPYKLENALVAPTTFREYIRAERETPPYLGFCYQVAYKKSWGG
jgi:hypothetical protein